MRQFAHDLREAARTLRKQPRFLGHHVAHARARHRRGHRDLQRRQRRAAEAAAVPECRPARQRLEHGARARLRPVPALARSLPVLSASTTRSSRTWRCSSGGASNLTEGGSPEVVDAAVTTHSYFPTLGVAVRARPELPRRRGSARRRPAWPCSAIGCGRGGTAPIARSSDAPSASTAPRRRSSASRRRGSTRPSRPSCGCRRGSTRPTRRSATSAGTRSRALKPDVTPDQAADAARAAGAARDERDASRARTTARSCATGAIGRWCGRCSRISSAACASRCGFCSARSSSCCSSRAATSRTCV